MERRPVSLSGSAPTDRSNAWVGTAFGLSLEADLPVYGLEQGRAIARPPRTHLQYATPDAINGSWPWTDAKRVVDQRYNDGRVMMTVDAHPKRGYRIDAPDHGMFRIAIDGSVVDCAPAAGPAWRWHRPFFAQALPIAAALSGIEVLHASGVVVDDNAIAFVGHSGAGKTSLAVHLVDQGASLLADDVVALSPTEGVVRAHPGTCFANVAVEQFDAINSEQFGRVVGHSEKLHVLVNPMATAPATLGVLYFLERRDSVSELDFELLQPPDPGQLFGATFLSHVVTPARMTAQLDVASMVAAEVATYRLRVPPGLSAAELAPLVAAHSRETCAQRRPS